MKEETNKPSEEDLLEEILEEVRGLSQSQLMDLKNEVKSIKDPELSQSEVKNAVGGLADTAAKAGKIASTALKILYFLRMVTNPNVRRWLSDWLD